MKMLKTLLLIGCVFVSGLSAYPQYNIGHLTTTFVDPARDNRTIPVEIYYPTNASGENVPVAVQPGGFPVIAFGHGFLMSWDAYETLWTSIVAQGYIMAFPKTEGGLLPSHSEFGADIAFVIIEMNTLNNDAASIFYQGVSAMNAVMGHSMGGGAALLAAASYPTITAVAVLAAAETNPSAISAAESITTPAFIVAGSNDCVTPPSENQYPMYTASQSDCKTYLNITGGSHCQMADSNFFCNIGEGTCSPSADITREVQQAIVNNYLSLWLSAVLKGNCESGAAFNVLIDSDDSTTYERNCLQCQSLSLDESQRLISIVPNPFTASIQVNIPVGAESVLVLSDSVGRQLKSVKINGATNVDTSDLPFGTYFYTLTSPAKMVKSGKLIKH